MVEVTKVVDLKFIAHNIYCQTWNPTWLTVDNVFSEILLKLNICGSVHHA